LSLTSPSLKVELLEVEMGKEILPKAQQLSSDHMRKAILLILDGWGIGPVPSSDAILTADTPYFDGLLEQYQHTTLITHGEDVGLPDGQMGNSEVGHMNIGAGRVVWQELARINKEVREGHFVQHPVLLKAFAYAKEKKKKVHLLGLVSDGGVHSHINHLKALCDAAQDNGVAETYIHAFTDGRDCDPKSGLSFMTELQAHIQAMPNVHIATVIGRYYAMDRDKRWERVALAYDALVHGIGKSVTDPLVGIETAYQSGLTDEFITPLICTDDQGKPLATIQADDVVICFNFRTDRLRELTQVLSQKAIEGQNMQPMPLHYITMTRYDQSFKNIEVIYEKDDISQTLGEVLEQAGATQVRIAETEKYPHVTFFFSGGREEPFTGEARIMIPSPKVATYDLQPEMSANEITEALLEHIEEKSPDFVCLNFANTDMVGHTGVFSAAIKAAETVDHCLSRIVPYALHHGYSLIVIADHGNSDYMINEDGSPNTAHTTNPVPCLYISRLPIKAGLRAGRLADIAPTLLAIMGIEKPSVMTGESLLVEEI
jgi:2,3-bisphosphoglycerate-independent phosphoglycerate mutase